MPDFFIDRIGGKNYNKTRIKGMGKIKKFLAFLAIAIAAADAFACCARIAKKNELDGKTEYCGSYYNGNQYGTVANGYVVFSEFLKTHRCRRDACNVAWVEETGALCAGFDMIQATTTTNRARLDPKADAAGRCWKWTCKTGYQMEAGGLCTTASERCTRQSQYFTGADAAGNCIPKWCSGWTGYNAATHTQYINASAGCVEFRCKAGSGFTTRPNCQACNPIYGVVGGCYITPEADGGNYVKCTDQQYTDYAASGAWGQCKALATATDDVIKKCWKCPDIASITACYNGGSTCERAP